jgi:hypothetical protein
MVLSRVETVAGGRFCRIELQLRQRNLRRIDLDWRKIIFKSERAPISKAGTTVNSHCGELAMFATLRQSSGWAKGEFSLWQKTTRFIISGGSWQGWAWVRL